MDNNNNNIEILKKEFTFKPKKIREQEKQAQTEAKKQEQL